LKKCDDTLKFTHINIQIILETKIRIIYTRGIAFDPTKRCTLGKMIHFYVIFWEKKIVQCIQGCL